MDLSGSQEAATNQAPKVRSYLARGGVRGAPGEIDIPKFKPQSGEVSGHREFECT
jgi:hypothetical protein